MSVLISGMEMPKCCDACKVLCDAKSETGIIRPFGERLSNCPLIEIPEPHGRLIDMDDFLQEWPELESYRTAMELCEVIEAEPPKEES